jgi:hypothetical protein
MTSITVEICDVRGTVIFDRTQNAVFGLSALLGFQVALSVLTVSIATKIFRLVTDVSEWMQDKQTTRATFGRVPLRSF